MKHRFDPEAFHGVIPNATYLDTRRVYVTGWDDKMPDGVDHVFPWAGCVNEVDDQGKEGSCESASFQGILEEMIRRFVDVEAFAGGLQLDRRRLHEEAQKDRYPNTPYDPERGLFMGDSFRAAKRVGLIPTDAEEVILSYGLNGMMDSLQFSPIHFGVLVHQGFGSPNPDTGEIPEVGALQMRGGHAIHAVRVFRGFNGMPMWSVPQTWGVKYAWHGVCSFSHRHLYAILLDHPRVYRFDPAWLKVNREWEKWIVVP
jgi:hypothetical protein